jgi:hypothetical protein
VPEPKLDEAAFEDTRGGSDAEARSKANAGAKKANRKLKATDKKSKRKVKARNR